MAAKENSHPIALVTGASSGIGEAFAEVLAEDGYGLVLVARNERQLSRVSGVLTTKLNVPVTVIPCDLTRPGAVDEVSQQIVRRGISLDLVVNNAGFGLRGAAVELSRAEQLQIVDLNIRVLTELSLRYGAEMRERGRGGIINVSSLAGFMPGPYMAVYYASKAYVTSFSQAVARELVPFGVRVTVVCPGIVSTQFHRRAGMEDLGLPSWAPAMSARQVAELGYRGYKDGKPVVITGVGNVLMAGLARILPNRLVLSALEKLQG